MSGAQTIRPSIETTKMWYEFVTSSEANGVASEMQVKEGTIAPLNRGRSQMSPMPCGPYMDSLNTTKKWNRRADGPTAILIVFASLGGVGLT